MNFQSAEFETSIGNTGQLKSSSLPEVVFAGRSNVGKSSMINRLFGRKNLARVSSSPGKTATINFYRCGNLRFADLPGYGYAKVSKAEKHRWNVLIGSYFSGQRDIALVFSLLDMRHPPSEGDLTMVNMLIDGEFPFVCILTKADKLSASQRAQRMEAFRTELPCGDQIHLLPFSAQTGEGVQEVRTILEEISAEEERQGNEK